jgi:hypothetical protein
LASSINNGAMVYNPLFPVPAFLSLMLMALCYLPQEHIPPSFQRFKEGIDPEQSPMLMDLTKYIEKTWNRSR